MIRYNAEIEPVEYRCAYCGEINNTFADPSQGTRQTYIEDCQVCCRPNELRVFYDEWERSYQIRANLSQ